MQEYQVERQKRQQEEKKLKKAMAFQIAEEFCKKNSLSVEKLKQQRFDWIYGVAVFSQPSEVVPNGLTNDMETMPMPTLILKADDKDIEFEQTEYTQKYLAI